MGVLLSLTTEVARDVEALEPGSATDMAAFEGVSAEAAVTGLLGVCAGDAAAPAFVAVVRMPLLRFRLMMLVRCILNVSLSE